MKKPEDGPPVEKSEVEPEEKKKQTVADVKPAVKYSAVTDGSINIIETMEDYEKHIEDTKITGKPLLVKVCPPC